MLWNWILELILELFNHLPFGYRVDILVDAVGGGGGGLLGTYSVITYILLETLQH